jgi:hypothetical protein
MTTTSARALLLLTAAGLVLVTGCASYHGYPDAYSDGEKDLASMKAIYSEEQIAKCFVDKKVDCRDLIVGTLIRAIDLQYDVFRQQLYRSSGALNLTADVAVLGLSAAGTLLTPAGTKAILAGISGVVTGTKTSIDKNLLFDKSVALLLERMDALRSAKLLEIQKGLSKPTWDAYTLPTALVDIGAYYSAGTIPSAMTSINAQTGQKKADVEKEDKAFKESLGR